MRLASGVPVSFVVSRALFRIFNDLAQVRVISVTSPAWNVTKSQILGLGIVINS